jgi:hypothetical protein
MRHSAQTPDMRPIHLPLANHHTSGYLPLLCLHPLQSNQYFLLLFRNTAAGPIGFFRLHSDARACPAKDRGRQTEQVMEPQSDLEEGEHNFKSTGLGSGIQLVHCPLTTIHSTPSDRPQWPSPSPR